MMDILEIGSYSRLWMGILSNVLAWANGFFLGVSAGILWMLGQQQERKGGR